MLSKGTPRNHQLTDQTDAHVCVRVAFPTLEESGEGGRHCYFAFLPQVPLFFLRMRISNQLKVWKILFLFFVAPCVHKQCFSFGQRYLYCIGDYNKKRNSAFRVNTTNMFLNFLPFFAAVAALV